MGLDDSQRQYSFYRLATIGWANQLLRATLPLLAENLNDNVLVDLSEVVGWDSFGLTYLAACLERCRNLSTIPQISIRRPLRANAHQFLVDMGFYESVGLGDRFEARAPRRDKIDLVHITALQPGFVDGLLDFLESIQPFDAGLKDSMRMSFIELVQNFAEHAGSASGAWASGYSSHGKRISLCLLDLGQGIPNCLRSVEKYRRKGDARLIELATEPGVTSVKGPRERGLGLAMIRRFVRANRGAMTIISGEGRVRFRPDRKPIRDKIHGSFPGTAVFLSLVPTERGLYVFGDEDETNDSYCG